MSCILAENYLHILRIHDLNSSELFKMHCTYTCDFEIATRGRLSNTFHLRSIYSISRDSVVNKATRRLRAGRPGFESREEQDTFHQNSHTGPGANPVS